MTFDDLIRDGETAITSLIGRQEDLSLEFKANDVRNPIFEAGALNNSGRKILAKALSAFANSAGGVLILGIYAAQIDGVDQAQRLAPIDHLGRAETSVRDAAADLLQPKHGGIRVSSITCDGREDVGYIVVDVPRSSRRPHRSEARGQKEYFKRIGGRSYPMEHYDIEDAFRRVSAPDLGIVLSSTRTMAIGNSEGKFQLILALKNDGAISARSVSVQIWNRTVDVCGLDYALNASMTTSDYQGRHHIAAPVDYVVHPGEVRPFYRFVFTAKIGPAQLIHLGSRSTLEDEIGFNYALAAENLRVVECRHVVLKSELSAVTDFFKMTA